MKPMRLMGIMVAMLCSCESAKEKAAKEQKLHDMAESAGLVTTMNLARMQRKSAIHAVESSREQVAAASTPNALALAQDDLREARKELGRLDAEIEHARRRLDEIPQ